MMTRKDYIAIGKALRDTSLHLHESKIYAVAQRVADVFASDNPLFDRARFLRFIETGKEGQEKT